MPVNPPTFSASEHVLCAKFQNPRKAKCTRKQAEAVTCITCSGTNNSPFENMFWSWINKDIYYYYYYYNLREYTQGVPFRVNTYILEKLDYTVF